VAHARLWMLLRRETVSLRNECDLSHSINVILW
jgi:hypothetical protein